MTTNELERLVGMRATIVERGITFGVRILDSRTVYGRDELLVSPDGPHGDGQAWVTVDRVKVRES